MHTGHSGTLNGEPWYVPNCVSKFSSSLLLKQLKCWSAWQLHMYLSSLTVEHSSLLLSTPQSSLSTLEWPGLYSSSWCYKSLSVCDIPCNRPQTMSCFLLVCTNKQKMRNPSYMLPPTLHSQFQSAASHYVPLTSFTLILKKCLDWSARYAARLLKESLVSMVSGCEVPAAQTTVELYCMKPVLLASIIPVTPAGTDWVCV